MEMLCSTSLNVLQHSVFRALQHCLEYLEWQHQLPILETLQKKNLCWLVDFPIHTKRLVRIKVPM